MQLLHLLSFVPAFISVVDASAIPARASLAATPICGVRGYDRREKFMIQKQNIDTIAQCSTLCETNSKCKSYGYGKQTCRLYSKSVAKYVKRKKSSPYVLNDKSCKKTTNLKTKVEPSTTTSVQPPATTDDVSFISICTPNDLFGGLNYLCEDGSTCTPSGQSCEGITTAEQCRTECGPDCVASSFTQAENGEGFTCVIARSCCADRTNKPAASFTTASVVDPVTAEAPSATTSAPAANGGDGMMESPIETSSPEDSAEDVPYTEAAAPVAAPTTTAEVQPAATSEPATTTKPATTTTAASPTATPATGGEGAMEWDTIPVPSKSEEDEPYVEPSYV